MFVRDSLILFEVAVTIISNWCPEWLHFIPNPPITILSRIEYIARDFGGEAPLAVAWPALRSFFSEVATTEAEILLLDIILSSRPVFLEYLVVAYCLFANGRIDNLNVGSLIKRAKSMYNRHESENPNKAAFVPLSKGFYPVMPIIKKTYDWKQRELQRIRAEAEVAKTQMTLTESIEDQERKLDRQRRNWLTKREIVKTIEAEQTAELRRRDREFLTRETRNDERALQRREERLKKRKEYEENAMTEWKNDCQLLHRELQTVEETRKQTWADWLKIREESGELARREVQNELDLLALRQEVQQKEIDEYLEMRERSQTDEQQMLSRATARAEELEDEKYNIRDGLEKRRRALAEELVRRQKEVQHA
jgi:hypothetical protein